MGKEGRVAARFKHQPALVARSASGLQGWDISFECQKEEVHPPYTLSSTILSCPFLQHHWTPCFLVKDAEACRVPAPPLG